MPILKIDHIVSFSSEDKIHTANNLLGSKTSAKWKCKSAGEKNAIIVFQLEKASVISGIDIGNEHSSYIEVFVCRSCDSNSDFKTFLAMSSFMSATESRQSTNINKVRMFKYDDFIKPECDEKWDRVKVVCTQPFNRHVQYGISFIKFHTNEAKTSSIDSTKKIGGFSIRPESPNELKPGYLFQRRKELGGESEKTTTVASAIRDENFSLLNNSKNSPVRSSKLLPSCLLTTPKQKNSGLLRDIEIKPKDRNELLYTDDEEKPHPKIDRLFEVKKLEKEKKQLEEKAKSPALTKKPTDKKRNGDNVNVVISKDEKRDKNKMSKMDNKNVGESSKRKIEEPAESSGKRTKCNRTKRPFTRLLEDVVLVISGIQNPDRATLRSKILEMGAKYKADWDTTCTHLVCAFMNTPKFNQVRGKGKIVTREWIEQCYEKRKKLPWRRYALDRREKGKDESEEEVWEQMDEPTVTNLQIHNESDGENDYDDIMERPSDTGERFPKLKETTKLQEKEHMAKTVTRDNSESRVEDMGRNVSEDNEPVEHNPYSADTDTDEETTERKMQIKDKPFDFFNKKTFFIDNNLEDYIEETLKNYIFIHEGSIADDPRETIDFIICGKEEAQSLKAVNADAFCILPDWVVDCHKCRQFITPDEYFIL